MNSKGLKTDEQIIEELKESFTDVVSGFFESAVDQLKAKDWKRFKGFTARPSRPGSACEYTKEINEFLLTNHTDLNRILNKFTRPTSRQKIDKVDIPRLANVLTPKDLCMARPAEPYSVTKMLRQYSSSSSSNSSSA